MNNYWVSTSFFILVFVGVFNSARAQGDWEKSPYQGWTKDQVKSILGNSPWAKTGDHEYNVLDILKGEEVATILLRSALPVRQALLRRRQLEAGYDKMSETNRNLFDEKNKALLECPACANYYVVSIFYHTIMLSGPNFVNDRKKFVYLQNDVGSKRELVNFNPQIKNNNYEAIFFFPRLNEKGESLLNKQNKKFTFRFDIRSEDGKGPFPFTKAEFDVSQITRNGEVVF